MRVVAVLICVVLAGGVALAENEAARAHFKRGLAAYALGRYAEAAQEYEAAFDLEPQAALLYDAAQAHRLAGNRERALLLYQNCLRLFPDAPQQKDVRRFIDMLQKAIAADHAAGQSPPVTPVAPVTSAPATTRVATTNAPATSARTPASEPATTNAPASNAATTSEPATSNATTSAPATTSTNPSLTATPPRKKRPAWVWGVVGGAAAVVVVGLAVGLSVGLSGTSYPAPAMTVTVK